MLLESIPTKGGLASVGMTVPAALLAVSPAAVSTSGGSFAVTLVSQAANLLLASPDLATGLPTFRAISANDLPIFTRGSGAKNGAVPGATGPLPGTEDRYLRADGSWIQPALSDLNPAAAAISMGGFQINSLATPALSTDAATKGYADAGDATNAASIPTSANPSASVGTAAVNGSAVTFMRSDAAPALGPVPQSQIINLPKLDYFYRLNGLAVVAVVNNRDSAGYNTSGTNYTTWKVRHQCAYDVSDLQFIYVNSAGGGAFGGDTANTNAITVKSAVQHVGTSATDETPPRIPITFAGARTITIPGSTQQGIIVTSDLIPFTLSAGEDFFTRQGASTTSSSFNVPVGGYIWGGTGASGEGIVTNNDYIDTGNIPSGNNVNGNAFGPVLILGRLTQYADLMPTIALAGDSIMYETGETTTISPAPSRFSIGTGGLYGGFGVRAISGLGYPYFSLATGGEKGIQFAGLSSVVRFQLLRYASHCLCNYGANDLSTGGQTLAGMKAMILAIAYECGLRGVRFAQCTILPQTTSTDSWATATNQTVTGAESIRTGTNDWIRDSSNSGFVAQAVAQLPASALAQCGSSTKAVTYFDICAPIEANSSNALTTDGGRWKTTGVANGPTTDGTHPTSAYHALVSAAVTPTTWFNF